MKTSIVCGRDRPWLVADISDPRKLTASAVTRSPTEQCGSAVAAGIRCSPSSAPCPERTAGPPWSLEV